MSRRLLLVLAGLGTSAAAVVLWSGTAHPLAPVPPVPRVPPVPVGVTQLPLPRAPRPPVVGTVVPIVKNPIVKNTVETVTSRVGLDRAGAREGAVPTRVVSQPFAVPAIAAMPGRVAVPRSDPSDTRASRAPRPPTAGDRPARHARSTQRFKLAADGMAPTSAGAPTPPIGVPFALCGTKPAITPAWSRRLRLAAGHRVRPGFLVGSGSPG